jgi:hypothetical protein
VRGVRPYADGGAAGGSVFYSGLNGMRLGDIVDLVYTAKFSSDIDTGGTGAPYLRVFLEGERTTLSSPRTHSRAVGGRGRVPPVGRDRRYCPLRRRRGDWPDSPWQVIAVDHADEVISGIYVTVGFSAGTNLTGCLRTLGVNESVFLFGS